jgi:protease-4
VASVVVRIASPGGSGLASDLIWRAVGRLRARKPVVVSLGDVAASGGYYIAAAGAPVFAQPGTITGSIGVIAGKANLFALYQKVGITKELVSRGQHAALYSDYFPLGPAERERLETEARGFYDDFLDKVAAGRRLARDAVAQVAEGRVWTGRQALAHGLVDQMGGLDEAIAEAKALAGIPRTDPVPVMRLPRPPRLWRLPLHLLSGGSRLEAPWRPWLSVLRRDRIWALLPFHLRFF